MIRFNEQGPDGLINKVSPGAPGKLTNEHKAFLARLVEDGPIPALDGVVRWRACDLIMRLHQEFGISGSDDTVYRSSTISSNDLNTRFDSQFWRMNCQDVFLAVEFAWNTLIDQPWKIMSIDRRDWATVGYPM